VHGKLANMLRSTAAILSLMILMTMVAMPTDARRSGRKNCATRVGSGRGCNSNVSFFKRLLEEKLTSGDQETPQPEVNTLDSEDESQELGIKMQLLLELLKELQTSDTRA